MINDKISIQMKKGVLEYLILAIIAREQVYASDIIETLKSSDLLVVEGTLYPLLSRLKTEQLVSYSWIESQQWPPRKYYTITSLGHNMLGVMRDTRSTLEQAVTSIDHTR